MCADKSECELRGDKCATKGTSKRLGCTYAKATGRILAMLRPGKFDVTDKSDCGGDRCATKKPTSKGPIIGSKASRGKVVQTTWVHICQGHGSYNGNAVTREVRCDWVLEIGACAVQMEPNQPTREPSHEGLAAYG